MTADTACLKYLVLLTWPQPPILSFFYSKLVHLPKFCTMVTAPFVADYAVANKSLVPVWILPIVTRKIIMVTATFMAGFA